MCEGWEAAYWLGDNDPKEYPKHWPDYGLPWRVNLINTKNGPRRYHNDLQTSEIRALEMSYREQGMQLPTAKSNVATWIVVDQARAVVGASDGKETNVVLVKREKMGAVHGHPINIDELKSYVKKSPGIRDKLKELGVL